jgi:hypothetical protein
MFALFIIDGLHPPQQGFHEIPQEFTEFLSTLVWSLKNLPEQTFKT